MSPLLSVRDLVFSYNSEARVLNEVTLEIDPGEIVALTGVSGRGKSTLLYVLGLLLRPSAGEVWLRGTSLEHATDAERSNFRSRHFGFVFQDAALNPSRSILDNVLETCLYRGENPREQMGAAKALLEQLGVQQRSHHKPGQVSGGQAQRIALCRALLHEPSIVLADEPTGNLDSITSEVVMHAFRQRADAGAAVVIATHDAAVVARADRATLL